MQPVGLGALTLALVTVGWSRLLPGVVHYPVRWFDESPPVDIWGAWTEQRLRSEPKATRMIKLGY